MKADVLGRKTGVAKTPDVENCCPVYTKNKNQHMT